MSTRPIGRLEPRRHLAPEESDSAFAQKRRRFLDGLERAIAEANREIIGTTLSADPGSILDADAFLRLAVRVAELRARYIAEGLAVAAGQPDPAAIEPLLVSLFFDADAEPPKEIVLDLAATDDPHHGHLQGRFLHG